MDGIQPLDYICIFGYLAVVVGIGVYFGRNQCIDDFFVAKRSIHWSLQCTFATRSLKDCQKSMSLNVIWNSVLGSLLYFMGIGIFAYYGQLPEQLTEGTRPDQWATHFVVHGLPAGLTGLMLAALLAAVMSTMDSGIHSLSTVTIADFIQRFDWGRRSEQAYLRLARRLTVVWGNLVTGLSLLICQISEKTETSLLEVADGLDSSKQRLARNVCLRHAYPTYFGDRNLDGRSSSGRHLADLRILVAVHDARGRENIVSVDISGYLRDGGYCRLRYQCNLQCLGAWSQASALRIVTDFDTDDS